MKEQRYDTVGGLTAPILIYETVDEAEKVEAGGILREGNNNMVYRGVLPAARDIACSIVEDVSGIERQSEVVGKTKAGKDIVKWETEGKFVNRVLAAKGWDDLSQFQDRFDEACRAYKATDEAAPEPLAVDVKGREYVSKGPKRLAAIFKNTAARVIAAGTIDKFNTDRLSAIGKTFVPSNDMTKTFEASFEDNGTVKKVNVSDKDAEALGWLIKEWDAFRQKDALTSIA